MKTARKVALVTGATSGIGRATCILLSQEGFDIIACGRREDRLKSLASELDSAAAYQYLVFDVRNREEVVKQIGSLQGRWTEIDLLVNNAGNAHGLAPVHEGDAQDWDAMLDINVKGLLYVTRAVIPGMIQRASGQIINVGSIAGKEVYQSGNVYCASKFAVDALSTGLRKELYNKGIRVGQVCPGLVETEFSMVRFKGDESRAAGVYKGYTPLTAFDVADAILYMATRPPHVNVGDMLLLPADQASSTEVNRR